MLYLPIKKQWYDMILSGEKKEEYRDIKPYYTTRLTNEGFLDKDGKPTLERKWVVFRNGYCKTNPTFSALCSVEVSTGREKWGAEQGVLYYVLTIHSIKTQNHGYYSP